MELRPYQVEAVKAVQDKWKTFDKLLLVLPTGCGKTIVFSTIAAQCAEEGKRVLILAHRGELLEQARDKLMNATGIEADLEKAQYHMDGTHMVTVASMQTLAGEARLNSMPQFDVLIIDEAHHVLSESYKKILEYFSGAKVLGVTATPDRGDMKELGEYFDDLAYEYSIRDAIASGYLSPIRAMMIPLQIDLGKLHVQAGDYKTGEIGAALDPYLEEIARKMVDVCMDRKTVVFLPLIETSQKFCRILNEFGFRACEVNGNSQDRAEILADFDTGKYNVLCNSMLLTEGWDCPSVDTVIVLRPTKVRSLYCQMVGRGTRLHPGKSHLLIIDFLWMTDRHDLCRPACLISRSQEVSDKMLEMTDEDGADLLELEEEAIKEVDNDRERSLAEQLEKLRARKARLVDPLLWAEQNNEKDLFTYDPQFKWEMQKPSEKQLQMIERFGIDPDAVNSKGYATALISAAIRNANKPSEKQVKMLERKGFQNVPSWSKKDCSKIIGILASNNWKVPAWLNPATYIPGKEEEQKKEVWVW